MRAFTLCLLVLAGCTAKERYSLILLNGIIYDDSGNPPFRSDTIAAIGELHAVSEKEIDVNNLQID
ncbi:MAG: hypothetical protein KIT62_12970 [Cyclobacteriaceae bacterium]|nr:hypothetical protein [Cyclobacteriaceae bacterium]